jgi:hypothetical protein
MVLLDEDDDESPAQPNLQNNSNHFDAMANSNNDLDDIQEVTPIRLPELSFDQHHFEYLLNQLDK